MASQSGRRGSNQPKASLPYMPGYGILDADKGKGLLPWSWAVERLENAKRYWLATTRPNGAPHVMPVWGIWLDGAFCFMTSAGSRKGRNLAVNPRCVISLDHRDEVVVLEGIAKLVEEPALIQRFKDIYQKKYNFDMEPYNDPVSVVRPRVVLGHIEDFGDNGFTQTATRWTFDPD